MKSLCEVGGSSRHQKPPSSTTCILLLVLLHLRLRLATSLHFTPKNGANMLHFWWKQHKETLAADRCRSVSRFQTCQLVFSPSCSYGISSGSVQGGPPPIKRQQPGHCPINQVVNVIRRMWDVAANGADETRGGRTFILQSGMQWEVEPCS